jgi:(+)-trans-carveol dehydrogenase
MPGRVDGKVAFVTGAARGQGRSHALRLAREGADIIAIDLAGNIGSVPYDLGTADDLAETVEQVKALDRRIVATRADVRDYAAVKRALDEGVAQLGRLDIVCANAGVYSFGRMDELTDEQFDDMIDVNLKGVWHTAKAGIPHLKAAGGGSIVLTSSVGGSVGIPNIGHYVAAKHGVVGLMKTLAVELGADLIRVNCVAPTTVDTAMIHNAANYALFAPDLPADERTRENLTPRFGYNNVLPIHWVEPADVSNAVLWLASDEAKFVTGLELKVDAGQTLK